MKARILLVDDEPNLLAGLRRGLGNRFSLTCAGNGKEALALLQTQGPFAAVVSDLRMPGMDGLELLRECRRLAPEMVRLVLSGEGDFPTAIAAINEGAVFRFHTKPVSADVLAASIDSAVLRHHQGKMMGGPLDPSQELLRDAADFRRGLEKGELRLYLQPQFRLADGCLAGAEGLVRWQHPELGLLLPGAFLGTVEAAGMMGDLTAWVIDVVCAEAARLQRQGHAPLRLAANVTAYDLNEVGFIGRVQAALARHRITSEWLELELTEGAAVADMERTRTIMDELTRLGVETAIDDFGTGYASFAWLRQLAVNKLKIDRSFVQDIAMDREAMRIVETILSLARDMGITVVAEGIETLSQRDLLRSSGCDLAQGFYLGRPMPAEKFAVSGELRQTCPS